ncbi:MAG: hypothetical protein RLN72_03165, partial [Henriciella sp.]
VRDRSSTLSTEERDEGWVAVEIRLTKLRTIKESKLDRGSDSDEPFVIFHIAPLNGLQDQSYTYLSPPFEDMDDDEEERFPSNSQTRRTVKIPPEGILVLSTAIYESDDETLSDRRELMTEFVTGMDTATQRPAAEFTDTLGRAIAEDWMVASVEAYAFHRGAHPLAGTVLKATNVGEIEGGDTSRDFELDWRNLTDFAAAGVEPVLNLESPTPDARTLLEGKWHSNKYQCGDEIPYVGVEIGLEADDALRDIIAVKTKADGDQCVNETPGEEGQTFRGHFEDGALVGERFIRPPPEHRLMEYDPENRPLDVMPDYDDPSIHPKLGLEGNWFVNWAVSEELPAMVALSKGGARECWDYEDGCWYHYKREPDAEWSASFWQPGNGGASTYSDELTISASGRVNVDWPYGVHGHWGGSSELAASDAAMGGNWRYGEDKSGPETWTRVRSSVSEVEATNGEETERKPVGEPVTIYTDWVSPDYYMRGNRSGISLRLYGANLWGIQHVFMPRYRDLEVSGIRYICNWDGETGYESHSNWKVCLEQGGVRGIEVNMNVWSKATTGPHEIFVNGEAIPFNL